MLFSAAVGLAVLLPAISCQQFEQRLEPYELLGLSDECFGAVNTTFKVCSRLLRRQVNYQGGARASLNDSQLKELCVDGCLEELKSLRTQIESACSSDKVVRSDIAYPGTYMIDNYILGYNLACRKDPKSGQFCDVLFAKAGESEDDALSCSDCLLGSWKAELESPLGYDEEYASDFAEKTSSCKATGYTFATPTSYALNSTTRGPTPTMACDSPYVVKEGDSCASIAKQNNVSTNGIVSLNSLGQGCQGLRQGRTVCLPETCAVHKIVKTDDCATLASKYNTAEYRLLAWNPMLNPKCTNLESFVGWYMCVSSPGGEVAAPVGESTATAAPVPTNAHQESQKNCAKWYTVHTGDDCAQISVANGIDLVDFYFLNPSVDSKCTNLWLDTAYCVEAVGDIAIYTSYPVSLPSTSFTRPTPTSETTTTRSPLPTFPLASGTAEDCVEYTRGVPGEGDDKAVINSCKFIANMYKVSVDDLLKWNPSLSKDSCVLSTKFKYCVAKVKKSGPSGTPFSAYCQTYGKDDIVDGTDPSCTCYDYQEGGLDGCRSTLPFIGAEAANKISSRTKLCKHREGLQIERRGPGRYESVANY
ncbi:hypothetical protein FDECE_9300 [Fusarium decemcellulare]|nr:hypothetical protein FDECE_9300 [Fusarium decemcellulare]